jgi:hypothetical protein
MKLEDCEIEIQRLKPLDNEIIIIKVPIDIFRNPDNMEQIGGFGQRIQKMFPLLKVLIVSEDFNFSTITKEQLKELGLQKIKEP